MDNSHKKIIQILKEQILSAKLYNKAYILWTLYSWAKKILKLIHQAS